MKRTIGLFALIGSVQLASADEVLMREAPGAAPAGVVLAPSVVAGFEHFHYEETGPLPTTGENGVLDQHTAFLPTVTLAVEASALGGHLFARGELSLIGGSMTYEGATQAGMPVTGPIDGSMTHEALVIGGRGQLGKHMRLGGYIGFDHRTWDRDMRPLGNAGYREQYAWSSVPIGAVLEYAATPKIAVAADAALLWPPWLGNLHLSDLHATTGTSFDPLDINTRTDLGIRIRVGAAYALTRELRILVGMGLEQDHNLDGPPGVLSLSGVPLFMLHEPSSTTTRITTNVGAGYTF